VHDLILANRATRWSSPWAIPCRQTRRQGSLNH